MNKIKLWDIELILIYLIGFMCTFNALKILGISISNYFMIALALIQIYKICVNIYENKSIKNINFCKTESAKYVLLFFASILLSYLAKNVQLPSTLLKSMVSSTIKYVIAFFTLFLFYDDEELKQTKDVFLKAFLYGGIVNMVWGYLQVILYILFKFKLNTFIFGEILHMGDYAWDTYVGNIGGEAFLRMKGIGWEAANFSLDMIVCFLLSKKYDKSIILKIFFALAIVLSTSKSAYLTFAVVIIFDLLMNWKKYLEQIKNIRINKKQIIIAIIALLIFIVIMGPYIIQYVSSMVYHMLNIFDVSDPLSSNSIHISYYVNLIKFIKTSSLCAFILGTGYFIAGYPIDIFYSNRNILPWNPETDFVTLLLGNGLVGFLLYYFVSFKAYLKHRKDIEGLIVVAIICQGITYLVIRGTWSFLLILYILCDSKEYQKSN